MKRCFQELKIRFRDGAVLHQPDMNAPSTYTVGGVLEQLWSAGSLRPVAFFSRKLQGKEGYGQRGWSIREKETYTIVATLYNFRSWLRNFPIKVQVQVTRAHTIRSINRSFAELNRFGDGSGIDFQALISGIMENSCKALKSGIHAMLNRIV